LKFKKQVALLQISSILLILFASLFTARSVFISIITNQEKDNLEKAALYLDSTEALDYNNLLKFSQINQFRVTVINLDGKVLFDSEKDIELMDNHLYREEIKTAKIDNVGFSYRKSKTTKVETLYCAIKSNNNNLYIRVAAPISNFSFLNSTFMSKIIPIILIITILLGIALFFILRYLFIPIESLVEVSKGYAKGELDVRTHINSPLEIKELSETMNSMAQELQKIIKNLEKEKNEYALVLQSMQEGVIFLNNKKEIVLCNKAAVSILGKAIKKKMVLRDIISDIDLNNQINDALNNFEKSEIELCFFDNYTAEMAHIYGKGKEKHLRIRITAMIQNDNCEGILLTISHELKTPLMIMQVTIQGILDDIIAAEDQDKELNNVLDEINKSSMMIQDMLQIYRLDDANTLLEITEFNLSETVEFFINDFENAIRKFNLDVDINIQDAVCIEADSKLIKRVISNFLTNAIKYTPIHGNIYIEVSEKDGKAYFELTNYGSSINQDEIEKIWLPFYRIDVDDANPLKTKGSGIGLYLVSEILKAHHAEFGIKNVRNGVKAYFYINKKVE